MSDEWIEQDGDWGVYVNGQIIRYRKGQVLQPLEVSKNVRLVPVDTGSPAYKICTPQEWSELMKSGLDLCSEIDPAKLQSGADSAGSESRSTSHQPSRNKA